MNVERKENKITFEFNTKDRKDWDDRLVSIFNDTSIDEIVTMTIKVMNSCILEEKDFYDTLIDGIDSKTFNGDFLMYLMLLGIENIMSEVITTLKED